MAQDPSEPPAEQVGLPGSGNPATLWDDFAPPLRAFLARRVPAGVEPDDLLQDVFLRVVKHLDSLRSTERPEAWLFQIARNALRDALRARQRKDGRTDSLDVDVPAVADTAVVRESEEELAPCLTAMIGRLAKLVPDGHRTDISPGFDAGRGRAPRRRVVIGHEVPSSAGARTAAPDAGAVLRDRCRRPWRRLRLSSAVRRRLRWRQLADQSSPFAPLPVDLARDRRQQHRPGACLHRAPDGCASSSDVSYLAPS